MFKNHYFSDEKHEADDNPFPSPMHPVCHFWTSPCMPAKRAHVFQHVRVVPVHTGTLWTDTHHTPHRTPHHNTTWHTTPHRTTAKTTTHYPLPATHNTQHTTHNNTGRQRKKTEKERGREKRKKTETERDEKTEEKKTKQDEERTTRQDKTRDKTRQEERRSKTREETRQEERRRKTREETRWRWERRQRKREKTRSRREKMKKKREDERDNEEREMKRGDFFFFKKCFKTLKPARWISPKCFEKKSLPDELFLHFSFESSESGRFWIIYRIRIRFFGPQELIQRGFSGAQYDSEKMNSFFNVTQRILTKHIDFQNWTFFFPWKTMAQRIEPFLFQYDSKNYLFFFLKIWLKELSPFFRWLIELNPFLVDVTQGIEPSFLKMSQWIEPSFFMTQRLEPF